MRWFSKKGPWCTQQSWESDQFFAT